MYPININLAGLPVVVLGGGVVAERKVLSLLEVKAEVTVISPDLTPALTGLYREKAFTWLARKYTKGDLACCYLAISTVPDGETVEAIYAEAQACYRLLNVVNDQAKCSFMVPAKFKRGNILFTVATGGRSPAMAKYLKNYLAQVCPEHYEQWLDMVEELRQEAIGKISSARGREVFWREMFKEDVMALVEAGEFLQAKERIKDAISSFGLKS